MRLYASQGRFDEALRQYEWCRRDLSHQLRVPPEPETVHLAQSIRANRRFAEKKSSISSLLERGSSVDKLSTDNDLPSIAVLPFVNLSSDLDHDPFVDGLTEDLITALSRINNLLVVAHSSMLTYKGASLDVKSIAEDLGVRYVMAGSVRRAGDRVRVTAQLIDAGTGHHVWAERYDSPLVDLLNIQDEITRSVAASTQTQVELAEHHAAEIRPLFNIKARDLVARARALLFDQTPDANSRAAELIEEAIRIDPDYPRAHLFRACACLSRIWVEYDRTYAARGFELAKYALQLAPRDEYAHLFMAWAWAYAVGNYDEAIAACERGLEINPNCSLIFGNLGYYLAARGRSQEAIKACEFALKLNPRDPSNFWRHHAISMAHFSASNYELALQESKRIARSRPHLPSAIIWAASAAGLEKSDEVRQAVEECIALHSGVRASDVAPKFLLRYSCDSDHARLVALLQKAGLPS